MRFVRPWIILGLRLQNIFLHGSLWNVQLRFKNYILKTRIVNCIHYHKIPLSPIKISMFQLVSDWRYKTRHFTKNVNHTHITNTVSFYVKSDSHSRTKSCLYTYHWILIHYIHAESRENMVPLALFAASGYQLTKCLMLSYSDEQLIRIVLSRFDAYCAFFFFCRVICQCRSTSVVWIVF